MNVDVIIVGAGPVGLAAAIEIGRRQMTAVVVDKGSLVNSLVGYPNGMEFFSTPDLLEIGGYPLITARYKPVREEALDYYRRVADAEDLNLLLYESVVNVEGEEGAFVVQTSKRIVNSRYVVVATGFFDQPNRLDVPGANLPKVSHYFKEAFAYAGREVLIVGAKNSAAKAALQCRRRGATVTMAVRGPEIGPTVKYWIRPDLINRIKEGSIRAYFDSTVSNISEMEVELQTPKGAIIINNDIILAMTGYHPDYGLLKSFGIEIEEDEAETPVYDDSTFETNRPGMFIAGTICGGRFTSRWFIENGRFHAKVIAETLAQRGN